MFGSVLSQLHCYCCLNCNLKLSLVSHPFYQLSYVAIQHVTKSMHAITIC